MPEETNSHEGKRPMIMVVDDEQEIRRLLQETFGLHSYDAVTVSGGAECLSYLRAAGGTPVRSGRIAGFGFDHGGTETETEGPPMTSVLPDLILLDVAMPNMDGWETLRRLKRDPVTARIPVVMLTTYPLGHRSMEDSALEQIDDYITKPFTLDRLMSAIEQVLAKQASADLAGSGDVCSANAGEAGSGVGSGDTDIVQSIQRYDAFLEAVEKDPLLQQLRDDERCGWLFGRAEKAVGMCRDKLVEMRSDDE